MISKFRSESLNGFG